MIGKTISHYQILEKLGEGGMGIVYKARDTKLNRTVALKFLPSAFSTDDETRTRFIKEAQTASSLDHPNICSIYEIGETEEGQSFIAMACYDGETLRKLIENTPLGPPSRGDMGGVDSLSVDDIISIIIQIAKGLARAHEEGIVHRDIKPANIMITERGEVKILDFGLAKLAGQTRLTRAGTTMGTVAYMSPEQARGEEADQRSDIWSLGVVLYEMLSGELPFKGEFEQAMIYSIINEEPELITNINENVSQELHNIVLKSLAKNPENRYQSIDELLFDFKKSGTAENISFDESLTNFIRRMWRKKQVRRISAAISVLVTSSVILFLFWPTIVQPTPIAIISFENQTGDENNDRLSRIIPDLLITNLQQSGSFKVLTWERLHDLIKQLGKDSIEFINSELGFELCHLEGIPNIVIGSIAKVGNIYATDLKILDVETKEILQTAQARGEGDNSIFEQIDELTKDITTGLGGVPEEKFSRQNRSIMEVTTTSLEAYNYFLRGREDFEKGYVNDARKFLEKAIDIDSTFAVAYLYLAETYGELENLKVSKDLYEKAKRYSEKAIEKDRLMIESYYARIIENDMEKHVRILNEIVEKYPQEKKTLLHLAVHSKFDKKFEIFNKILDDDPDYGLALKGLANLYAWRGDLRKADEYLKKYASVSPGDADPFRSMANIYYSAGKLDEAIVKYKEALAVKSDFGSDWILAYIYALKENYNESMRLIDQNIALAPSPGLKALGTNWKGFYSFWLGRYDSALSLYNDAIMLSESIKEDNNIGMVNLLKAWLFFDLGDFDTGKKHFNSCTDSWISLYPEWATNNRSYRSYIYGLVDLKEGRIDSAESRLAEMKSFILDRMLWKNEVLYNFHVLQSEILLAKDSVDRAISEYKKISAVESPGLVSQWLIIHNLDQSNVLARAYIQQGEINKAIAEYEQMITFDPNKGNRRLVHPRYHYHLAKLYEQNGQVEKATLRYKRFLEIWENADDDLPEKTDAQERLTTLLNTK